MDGKKGPENYQWDLTRIKGLARAGISIAMGEGVGDLSQGDSYLALFSLIEELVIPIQNYMADPIETEPGKLKVIGGNFRR
jgi:hypothetical protein